MYVQNGLMGKEKTYAGTLEERRQERSAVRTAT